MADAPPIDNKIEETKRWAEQEMRAIDRLRIHHPDFVPVLQESHFAATAVLNTLNELVENRDYEIWEAADLIITDLRRKTPPPVKRIERKRRA